MRLSLRQLNRATLARQMLLGRQSMPIVCAVRRVLAVQAQEPASPYVALWNRLHDFDPVGLDMTFGSLEVVRAPLLRLTLHAVAADDLPVVRPAMRPALRAAALLDRRFTSTGLSVADADRLADDLVAFAAVPRTREEILAHLGPSLPPGVWRALRLTAPLVRAPGEQAWSFDRAGRFVTRPDDGPDLDPDAATQRLIVRYLQAFGPASPQDFAQFTMLRRVHTRAAWDRVREDLVTLEDPRGTTLFDLPDGPLSDGDVPAPPRLLPMWDSVLLAYADRGRVLPDAYRAHVIRRNGDVLPSVLVDGFVAGAWRHADAGIEVASFHALGDEVWDDLAREARGLSSLLNPRDGGAYGRFGHWWATLPAVQSVRVA